MSCIEEAELGQMHAKVVLLKKWTVIKIGFIVKNAIDELSGVLDSNNGMCAVEVSGSANELHITTEK